MSKQTELVGLARTTKLDEVNDAYDAGALSNRNMIINGAMNVAQRSTSVTGIGATTGYFTCDRWRLGCGNTAGRLTASQTADGPNGISANCLKLDCTTADTSIAASELLIIQHLLEGQNVQRIGKGVAGAKQITVSFYVKANAAFTFVCQLSDVDNSRNISKLFNVTTDWVRQELTFAADVDDGSSPFDDNNATSLELNIWLHAGANYTGGTLATSWANAVSNQYAAGIDSFYSSTNNNFFITGVQMEVGPVATEFEHTSYSDELHKCQRFYYCFEKADSGGHNGFLAVSYNPNSAYLPMQFPVEMRATPTFRMGGLWATRLGNNNAFTASANTHNSSKIGGVFYTPVSSVPGSSAFWVEPSSGDTSNTAYLNFDAEL